MARESAKGFSVRSWGNSQLGNGKQKQTVMVERPAVKMKRAEIERRHQGQGQQQADSDKYIPLGRGGIKGQRNHCQTVVMRSAVRIICSDLGSVIL